MILNMVRETFRWLPSMKCEERRIVEIEIDPTYFTYTVSIRIYFSHGEIKMCQSTVSRLEVETDDMSLDYALEKICHMMKDEECQ